MKDKKIVLFPGYRYVVPADFERWLEKMASAGWHIDRISQWSSLFMVFRRGEPQKYRFVYDLQAVPRKDYRAIYEQFGWEYLGRMASIYIWRKAYRDRRPEAFSDRDSIIHRNRRTIAAISSLYVLVDGPDPRHRFIYRRHTKSELIQLVLGLVLSLLYFLPWRRMLKIRRNLSAKLRWCSSEDFIFNGGLINIPLIPQSGGSFNVTAFILTSEEVALHGDVVGILFTFAAPFINLPIASLLLTWSKGREPGGNG